MRSKPSGVGPRGSPQPLTSPSLQIKVWTANPQQFVEDEDDDTFSYTVRIAAQDLLLVSGRPEPPRQPLVFFVDTLDGGDRGICEGDTREFQRRRCGL